MLLSGSAYDEEAEDMEYRLRTGEVVDNSMYPSVPHMRSEQARLQTFSSWPSTAPVTPQDLAQAGLFYRRENDQVQCFCCSGILSGWVQGDTAWGEHSLHFPNCFFILGHDVGNIPLQAGVEEEGSSGQQGNTRSSMETFEERLGSFRGVQHPIDHARLATAGFYSQGKAQVEFRFLNSFFEIKEAFHIFEKFRMQCRQVCNFCLLPGSGDKVLCFRCGGGLKGWQPDEDPWEEHAKHYPG